MDANNIRLGSISANIDGDNRYITTITVTFNTAFREVTITREESTPTGGMDSYSPNFTRLSDRVFVSEAAMSDVRCFATHIIRGIKHLIDSECGGTVKRYGKPTKNFNWDHGARGLSLRNCLTALEGL